MPLYFFDIVENGSLSADEYGIELDDFQEARDLAIRILPDIARDELPEGDRLDLSCEVRDAVGHTLYRAKLMYRGERLA